MDKISEIIPSAYIQALETFSGDIVDLLDLLKKHTSQPIQYLNRDFFENKVYNRNSINTHFYRVKPRNGDELYILQYTVDKQNYFILSSDNNNITNRHIDRTRRRMGL